MAKNEEGEFELILGNKQLLSVFFIVVILLGVFFTMGYVVGRNSVPVAETAAISTSASETSAGSAKPPPMVVDPAKTATPATPGDTTPTPTTSTPPPGVAPHETAPKPVETPAVAQGGVVIPQPGEMYVQVLALAKPEAEVLVDVLGKKGFRAIVAPGPNERVFRVLVGPAKDTAEINKLRNDVEAAGFKGAFPKKY